MSLRQANGFTLIETLISVTTMGFVSLAFMSILLLNFRTNAKVDNMQDTMNAVRLVKERIGRDVREGRSLGDVYGDFVTDPATGAEYTTGSPWFPSLGDPVYGAGQEPPLGWPNTDSVGDKPAFPTNSTGGGPSLYQLNNQCLIVQVPITDRHNDSSSAHQSQSTPGWPTKIPKAAGNTGTGTPTTRDQDNVETHVYQVVPDPSNPGEYLLVWCSFPGYPTSGTYNGTSFNYAPAAHQFGPQVLVNGIIGPLDSNGNPKVFQYINKNDPDGTPIDAPTGSLVALYTGVVVNLEIRRHQGIDVKTDSAGVATNKGGQYSVQPIGLKTEVFLRNNALATTTGSPATP